MPRSCVYQVPVDTGFFTPLGLQPAAVCRLAFDGAGRWLGRHAISHRRLVTEHRTGFVFWSVQLVPGDPVGFFDADRLDPGGQPVGLVERLEHGQSGASARRPVTPGRPGIGGRAGDR